jgi:hypothetical protein
MVFFTQDRDFLRLHAAGKPYAGIVYCRQRKHAIGGLIEGLVRIWERLEPSEAASEVIYL